ncbi:MAG TPA: hypothetical protein OQH54_03910 [Nitrosopumilus sp.]|nr:hypothetical protein [Thermoproteota archaeon]HJJ22844.1 hypothetical protein [Nitrosopumilus sp.]
MVKIRVRSGRGTKIIEVDADAAKWTGDEFKQIQAARKAAAGNVRISSGRGTGTRKLSDTPEPKARPDTKGMTRSTGRGTGSRKSTGK